MLASFVESPASVEELVGRTAHWRQPDRAGVGRRSTVSVKPEVCVCVCSRVIVGCGGFWLNNLRTLFSNCGRAMFFNVDAAMSPRSTGVGLLLLSTLISIVIFVCRAFLCLKLL